MEALNIITSEGAICGAVCFNNLAGMLSSPVVSFPEFEMGSHK